jgi:hypothetical protein
MAILFENCKNSYRQFEHVAIDMERIHALANAIPEETLLLPSWDYEHCYHGDPERILSWIFLFNAINFSYWTDSAPRWQGYANGRSWGENDEAIGAMAVLAHAMMSGVPLEDPAFLKQLDIDDLAPYFYPAPAAGKLPLLDLRLAAIKELGEAFQHFGGAIGMLATSEFSAVRLVELLTHTCPSWEDTQHYNDIELPFRKRAWLCAAMVHGRFLSDPTRCIRDPESIPIAADYRLPQFLRASGVLNYAQELAKQVDQEQLILSGSKQEIEIRAATVVACEELFRHLKDRYPSITQMHIDSCLWNAAVDNQESIAPFHRTRTLAY